MNRILGKICIVLALCIPLIIGFGIIGVGIIFQLEIDLVGALMGFTVLSVFSISTFLKYRKEIIKELRA